jgi:isopenicillin N synthase-like dioxygenase
MAFKEIPILDLSEARTPESKPQFLQKLRDALLNVGFLYIKNMGIDQDTYDRVRLSGPHSFRHVLTISQVCAEGIRFFDIPEQEKLAIEMKNAPSFLGYSRLGNEITAHNPDWREQLDLSTPHPLPTDRDPLYHNLLAPNQWPNEKLLPNFRPIFEDYMRKMGEVSITFTSLIAESLGLPPTAFNNFFDEDQQHKLKIVKYPVRNISSRQYGHV